MYFLYIVNYTFYASFDQTTGSSYNDTEKRIYNMPFDGIVSHAIAEELHVQLFDGRIGKIQQPSRETILIPVRAGGQNHRLLLSRSGSDARIHITSDYGADNPASPPMFCMLLRKHIGGGKIQKIYCPDLERVVIIEIETEDELGDRSVKKLIVEIMGRHSNIILLNKDDIIIDSSKHVDIDISRVREILPAHPYIVPPAQNKLSLQVLTTPQLVVEAVISSEKKISGILLDKLRGFSPILCKQVCFLANIDFDKAGYLLSMGEQKQIRSVLHQLQQQLQNNSFSPCTVIDISSDREKDYHSWPLTVSETIHSFDTMSEALDHFYAERDIHARLAAKRADLSKMITLNLTRVQKRLQTQIDTLSNNNEFHLLQKYGELITANIYALKEGMSTARVLDYYSEEGTMIEITMDPMLTPQKNAGLYFKKYQKAKTACKYAESQLESLQSEVSYLESLLYAIENAESAKDFQEIRDEIVSGEYITEKSSKSLKYKKLGKMSKSAQNVRPTQKKNSSGNPAPAEPLMVRSKDGFEIFVGRNNRQNDRLTLKMSKSEDLWFHIKNFSGSHVVIRTEGKQVPDTTIEEAASYAVWHSKAKQSAKAEVDYTQIKNVKKPSGGKPGMVIYVHYETMLAAPIEPKNPYK